MDIYNAIMNAADHIEQKPEDFNYGITRHDCGSPCCAIGWIGHHSGETEVEKWTPLDPRTKRLVGVGYLGFEERMDRLTRGWQSWRGDPKTCARVLRKYAAKYHAPAKVVQPPDWDAIAARQTVGEHERSQELA